MKSIALSLLLAAACLPAFAQLEINRASQAELETLRGVGPQLSARILQAREDRPFNDWEDLRRRVAGFGPAQSARLSREGPPSLPRIPCSCHARSQGAGRLNM
jgi:competence protein ComEA